ARSRAAGDRTDSGRTEPPPSTGSGARKSPRPRPRDMSGALSALQSRQTPQEIAQTRRLSRDQTATEHPFNQAPPRAEKLTLSKLESESGRLTAYGNSP